ncbi:MAG: CinA family nicotinamide mononucleotide deamidase-related protein [Desulfobacterales bacterium]|jgi:nicotinamide-nucleotide amidase|nr:CinA family nicotinamide mononucleotide deamidase-related protein [Desulfobacterales bacterium]
MIAEILSTGDEVCFGAIVDSNAAHIAAILSDMGVEVVRHDCVADDLTSIVTVLTEIGKRADIAVITGGLGPTVDDITAEAAALAAGVPLVLNHTAKSLIENFFSKFSRKMADSDIKQAMLPEGSTPIFNEMGTAPGFIIPIGKCRCYFLPGVPREMERMLDEQVASDIIRCRGSDHISSRTFMLSVFGLPEAVVNDRLKGISSVFPGVKLGMLARFPVIQVKLTVYGKDKDAIHLIGQQAKAWTVDKLGETVFSTEGHAMETEVGEVLKQNHLTIAVAESCTGGLISHMLTNVAGSSEYFLLSAITYSNQAKQNLLGVSSETIEKYGAVHEETVRQMADGIRRISGADIGLSVSGIAGPTGATADKPVGTVCIGISMSGELIGRRFQSPFQERLSNKQIFAICALDMVRRELMRLKIKGKF